MKALALLSIIATVTAFAPQVASTVVWDYTLTYDIDDSLQTTSFSVSGLFASHPECSGWSVSSPTTSSTPDPAHRQRYHVSLSSGTIEQVVQEDGTVTTHTLTCPGGAAVFLNPSNLPTYFQYENDCSGTTRFVGSYSNPTGTAIPGWATILGDGSYLDLSARAKTCVSAKVGTNAAQIPFTGRVWSHYSGFDGTNYDQYGQICSPLMLGGIPIGPHVGPLACDSEQNHPSGSHYLWYVEAQGLDGFFNLGVGNFGGTWQTT